MGKMKTYAAMFCAMLAMGALTVSCSSEDEAVQGATEGKGLVKLSLNVGTEFQSRAITESDYTNLANYTVQILKDGRVVDGCEWKGNALPEELVELDNGSYTLKAFTGEEYEQSASSTEGFYVVGNASFNINSDQTSVSATCIPHCTRVKVAFDELMPDYFNNYYVEFSGTSALGSAKVTWEKDDADPVYLALTKEETVTATIKLVDKEGKVAEDIVRTKLLGPGKAWALTIAPAVENGNVGIQITIDERTNDHEVDIEIPSDWL